MRVAAPPGKWQAETGGICVRENAVDTTPSLSRAQGGCGSSLTGELFSRFEEGTCAVRNGAHPRRKKCRRISTQPKR